MALVKLNLGCGKNIRVGWINLDRTSYPGVDVICDVDTERLPFEDQTLTYICASHVLEHCWRWEAVVLECYRVLHPGGMLEVRVPFKKNMGAYHVRFFDSSSMDAFIQGSDRFLSLEPKLDFILVGQEYTRHFPLKWHLAHYLGIRIPNSIPIGSRKEIVWYLEKPTERPT